MKRRVDQYGEWIVIDASSLDSEIEIGGVNALHWPVYRDFRRDALAIGAEAVLAVLRETFKPEPDLWIDSDDEGARARIEDLSQLELITCVRIGFTINDGWFDSFQRTVHGWQGSVCSEEQKLGKRAMQIIADCRARFELADRFAVSARGIERAKELWRRALPCTSDEINRLASAHGIGAKTLQRARRALRVERHELRNEHGRVTGHRWTSPPN